MAVPQLTAAVDAAGTTVRLSLPTTATATRPAVLATDPDNGDALYVAALPDSGGNWQWKISAVQDQVLLLTTEPSLAPALPVLLNARVRRALARALKQTGTCDCQGHALEALRRYHALTLLLFAEGDYAGCQQHLTLLQDLEPCPCAC